MVIPFIIFKITKSYSLIKFSLNIHPKILYLWTLIKNTIQMTFSKYISTDLSIPENQVEKTLDLLQEGATIPFIARYRKEMTGKLDEVQIGEIKSTFDKYTKLENRKETILKAIEGQGKLTAELEELILNSRDIRELEDLYLPYKQKRKTRAETARKKGLEPLAKIIMAQREANVEQRAASFVKGDVKSAEDALQGARDIIAEWVNENKTAREIVRSVFEKQAVITSKVAKGKVEEAAKYKSYFQYEEKLKYCKSHQLLAIRRAESEGFLKVSIRPPQEYVLERLFRLFIKNDLSGNIETAITDSWKRLLAPSIENEFAVLSKEKADTEAIKVFAENLRQLLLSAPLGAKRILGIDPGFRTGCKLVCLDEKGDLLHNDTIYPHPPQSKDKQAMHKISSLIEQYKIQAIAIGNGTAGRETENLLRRMRFKDDLQVFIISEAGASVYSASPLAREEFPSYDVTVRGAISIGRRLMDPLAELVKIEPKSIGVGQYQHDVDQQMLKESLDRVVESCVNMVGVDVNTASRHLLTYVSGLGPTLAQNIVDYRKENGSFKSRDDLKAVPRMGAKAFEQCAGFLRIKNGNNPLDNSAVHPERYALVKKMAKSVSVRIADLIGSKEMIDRIDIRKFTDDQTGMVTLNDILKELLKPGLDPRKKVKVFTFAENIRKIGDLKSGMELPGIITNITNFGAFVDIGIKENGLIHLSNMADEYVSNPADYVRLNQQVTVKVLDVDVERKRIGLSLIQS